MLLSIITINYNNAEGLERTIKSVQEQTYPDIEHIIIDGGSKDGAVEIIKKYESKIAYWVSEPDNGIYNAMNKGVVQAHGDYCLFLNSGDILYDKKAVERLYTHHFNSDIVAANLECEDSSGSSNIPPEEITYSFFFISSIPHPSTLIRTELLCKTPYREDYKIISDWIFFFDTLILQNVSYLHVNEFLSRFDMGGISRNKEKAINEQERYLSSIIPPRIYCEFNQPIVKSYITSLQLPKRCLNVCRNVIRACQWLVRHGFIKRK